MNPLFQVTLVKTLHTAGKGNLIIKIQKFEVPGIPSYELLSCWLLILENHLCHMQSRPLILMDSHHASAHENQVNQVETRKSRLPNNVNLNRYKSYNKWKMQRTPIYYCRSIWYLNNKWILFRMLETKYDTITLCTVNISPGGFWNPY